VARRLARVVGLASMAALLTACSRGLPSDFAVYRGEGFSIGYPRGWEGCEGQLTFDGNPGSAAEFRGPTARNEVFPPLIQVTDEGTKRTFDHALKFHRLLLQVRQGYKQLAEDDLGVVGAKKAVRIEFEHEFPLPAPPGQPRLHGMTVLAEAPDGSVVSVLVIATAPRFERLKETFDDVLESLAVGSEIDQSGRVSPDLPSCLTQGTPGLSPSPSG